ncbi:MAG: 4-alpha-glucanotransferase [Chloroflexota bacterium]|nr:4-alpha-glucanotransferase [Chloroflexota bacterium]
MLLDRRRSGVLLHPTSLPSRFGIGDLGPAARDFLDYLARARQTLWQVLPIGPTGFGDSPYASPSAFAGNPNMISPELLVDQDLLRADELQPLAQLPLDRVDFARLAPLKRDLLRQAFTRRTPELNERVQAFRRAQIDWLDDFALFSAITDARGPWSGWDASLRDRDGDALDQARGEYAEQVDFHIFCQYLFFEQWAALRARANALGIGVVGDIPIFVALDSADVWAHPHLFKLDENRRPRVMAGVPPDYFSATGQLWGNPVYDWPAVARDGYSWWIARFRHLLELVDVIRVDHFRGFQAAWEVPAGAQTAVHGEWVPGTGKELFEAVDAALGGTVPIVAEDLGLITDEVRALLEETGFPGMKVLQFAFGDDADNPYLPHNYRSPNAVVYTGTHDNDTSRGWFDVAPETERKAVLRYLGSHGQDITFDLIRLALASTARTAIIPLQDALDLGSEARMNTPGAIGSSWSWRVRPDQLDPACADRLAVLTETYGRS